MVMVMVRMLVLQKIRINIELGVQVEAVEIEHVLDRHLAEMHHALRRARVHVAQAVLERLQFLGIHQIGLADENTVGKTHLAARFLALIELGGGVFGVHQGQNRVQQIGLGHLVVHEKGLRHRAGIGQAGGFDHDAVKVQLAFALFLGQAVQGGAQVFADGAANAAIAHLHDLFGGVRDQNLAVDVFLTKLVFHDGNFLAVGFGQDALEQRGFAGSEKAGEDGGGYQFHGSLGAGHLALRRPGRSSTYSCHPARPWARRR